MKQLIFAGFVLSLFAGCTANTPNTKKDDTTASAAAKPADLTYAYKARYSSDFVPGDPKNAQMVLGMWKMFDDNKLGDSRAMWADTVTFQFSDGKTFHGSRDSLIASTQAYRSSFTSLVDSVDAWISLHSVDKGDDWVLVWGHSYTTDKKGKKEVNDLHELWQVKNGKVPYVVQYAAPREN